MADGILVGFVSASRVPLATAAAMASDSQVLATAARVLNLPGGAVDLLLEALPHVLARLLPMKNGEVVDLITYLRTTKQVGN